MSWQLGDLELTNDHRTGYFVAEANFPDPTSFSSISPFRGQKAILTDIKTDLIKVQLSGLVVGRTNKEALAAYHVNSYDWIADPNNYYLIELGVKKWKILSCSMSFKPLTPLDAHRYNFTIIIIIDSLSCQGVTARSKAGTATSSPTTIGNLINSGSKDAEFESISLTGVYSGGNLTNPLLEGIESGLSFEVCDVLLEGATIDFSKNNQVHHLAPEDFLVSSRWGHNKYSSTAVTFSTNHLVFAHSSELKMYYSLKHALRTDPSLTLTASAVVGSPKLWVSFDNSNYYEIATITAGTIKYILDKLCGISKFYWKIVCGVSDSMILSYFCLESWHSCSGQDTLYVLAGATNESIILSFDSGRATYALSWLDNYTA